MADEGLDRAAKQMENVALELEKASEHARIAARHFRMREVPRGAAHTFAVEGHLVAVKEIIGEFAKDFRSKATTDVD